MEVVLSKYCDFCNGVRRTVDICEEKLRKYKPIYSIGQVIHNPQVTKELAKKGLKILNDVKKIPSNSYLLIRSHGISPEIIKEAETQDIKLIDAACPFVKYIQQICKQLKNDGYFIIITGDKSHPEVEALKGISGDNSMVISKSEVKLNLFKGFKRIGVVSQSTYTREGFYSVISKILNLGISEIRIFNTICQDSLHRREEIRKIASISDAVIIIGGRNSANTIRLLQISKKINSSSYHIEKPAEIKKILGKMVNINRIGVIAGASTPRRIIDEFLKNIKKDYISPLEKLNSK